MPRPSSNSASSASTPRWAATPPTRSRCAPPPTASRTRRDRAGARDHVSTTMRAFRVPRRPSLRDYAGAAWAPPRGASPRSACVVFRYGRPGHSLSSLTRPLSNTTGLPNTGVKLRSGARVYPSRRGHEPAPPAQPFLPFETGCRRELRQLERLVRRLLPPAATVDTLPQHYHPHPQGPSGALIPAHHRVSTTRSPSRPVRCVFRQRAAREFASSHNPPPLLQGGCAARGRRCQLHAFDIAGAVRRTLAISCEAVPASFQDGAGTRRRLRTSHACRP